MHKKSNVYFRTSQSNKLQHERARLKFYIDCTYLTDANKAVEITILDFS